MKIASVAFVVLLLTSCGGREKVSESAPAAIPGASGDPARGQMLVVQYGCQRCHVIPGVKGPQGRSGPVLTGMGTRQLINGKIPNTPENMVSWLLNPQAMDPNTAMPGSGATPEDARDMSAFMFTLK